MDEGHLSLEVAQNVQRMAHDDQITFMENDERTRNVQTDKGSPATIELHANGASENFRGRVEQPGTNTEVGDIRNKQV